MAHRNAIEIVTSAAVLLAPAAVEAATPTYYNSRAAFQADVTATVNDDYSNPAYVFIQTNAVMNGVFGETDYTTTGFGDLNIVYNAPADPHYCAGCNGSFELAFQTTSVGDATGVNGVGLDIEAHDMGTPYYAFITFADGTTDNIALPPSGNFWGVSAPERVERIHFGLSMGAVTTGGSFAIDDLIVGDGVDMTPCGDAITQAPEDCDDGGETAGCDVDCTFATCGDGDVNAAAGEICDEGGATPTCNADCTAPYCGDGIVNMPAGETCDDGDETAACDGDCTAAMCGDGTINASAGETCDDSAESPACDPDCTAAVCGDGYENNTAGEYCDDGNDQDNDGCSSMCTIDEVGSSSDGGTSGGEASDGGTSGGEATDTTGGGDTSGGDGSGDGPADSSGGEVGGAEGSGSGSASAEGSGSDGGSGGNVSFGSDSLTGGMSTETSGCVCRADGDRRGAGASMLLLFGLGALARRRRRAS